MNKEQITLLKKMKELIKTGHRRFANRSDRDYLKDLSIIGITVKEAWVQMYYLNENFYFKDPKSFYENNINTLTFKKIINGKQIYIKLKIEKYDVEETVCLSFHIDYK